MNIRQLPADEAAVRRYIEDLWLPYNRELEMLGNILSLLVQLDILDIYSERNNSNRYDLSEYDHAAMQELVYVLEMDAHR